MAKLDFLLKMAKNDLNCYLGGRLSFEIGDPSF